MCIYIEKGFIVFIGENYKGEYDKKLKYNDFDMEKINSLYKFNYTKDTFEETPESKEYEKQSLIDNFKTIEKKATGKRAEYLTAELLPLGTFRDLKLAKLEAERVEIETEYETMMTELITKYGEEILSDIV